MAKNLKLRLNNGETLGIRGEVVGSLGVTSMGLLHIKTGRLIPVEEGADLMQIARDLTDKLPGTWKAADTYEFGDVLPEAVRKPVRSFFGK